MSGPSPLSTPKVDEDDTWVLGLVSDGNIRSSSCYYTRGSCPLSSFPPTSLEVEGNLEQYSTRELAEEIFRRLPN